MDDPTREAAGSKFITIQSIVNPVPWAVLFYPGTVLDRRELPAGLDIQKWIDDGKLREASHEEVKRFSERFPISDTEEVLRGEKRAELDNRLTDEAGRAKRLSSKAVLCVQWIREFVRLETEFQRAIEAVPRRFDLTKEDTLPVYVGHARMVRAVYEPLEVLKGHLKTLIEFLLVEAQPFTDLQPLPLNDYLKALEYPWFGQVTPTWQGAIEYLERLRYRFQHHEPRPGVFPWIKRHGKLVAAIVVTGATVIGGLAKIIESSKQIRNDVSRKSAQHP